MHNHSTPRGCRKISELVDETTSKSLSPKEDQGERDVRMGRDITRPSASPANLSVCFSSRSCQHPAISFYSASSSFPELATGIEGPRKGDTPAAAGVLEEEKGPFLRITHAHRCRSDERIRRMVP